MISATPKITISSIITKLKPHKLIVFNVFGLFCAIVIILIAINTIDSDSLKGKAELINKEVLEIKRQTEKLENMLKITDIDLDSQSKKFILLLGFYPDLLATVVSHEKKGYLYAISGEVKTMLLMLKHLESQNIIKYDLQKISMQPNIAAAQILIYGISRLNIE